MSIVLLGSTSGSCTLQEQAVAGTTTLTLPTFNGTVGLLVSGTAVTASGASINFTSIPAGVRRITVILSNVAYAAGGQGVIQIGSGSLSTSGYTGTSNSISGTLSTTSVTNGFGNLPTSVNTTTLIGQYVLTNVTGNTWVCSGMNNRIGDGILQLTNGFIALGGALDRLSIVATTSTFASGTINILYE